MNEMHTPGGSGRSLMIKGEQLAAAAEVIAKTARTVLVDEAETAESDDFLERVAETIATVAHMRQNDRAGLPYITHPEKVVSMLDTTQEKCVGWLHDVLEDTDVKESDLRPIFGDTITDAVVAMTHREDVPYLEYVRKLKNNPLARKVKLADLRHNMDPSRQKDLNTDWRRRMEQKYLPAVKILMSED